MTTRILAAALIAASVVLSSCSTEPASNLTAGDAAIPTSSSAAPPAPEPGPPMHEHETTPAPFPPDGQIAGRTPADLTVAAMTAYIDPINDPQVWLERLAPYLSQQALAEFAYVDPDEIPATQLRGQPMVVDTGQQLLSYVQQDTDAGIYTVVLSVSDVGTWQVERISATSPPA